MNIGAKLGGSGGSSAPAIFWSRSLVLLNKSRILLNKCQILLNKSRILILHPHFSGPLGANVHTILGYYDSFLQTHFSVKLKII